MKAITASAVIGAMAGLTLFAGAMQRGAMGQNLAGRGAAAAPGTATTLTPPVQLTSEQDHQRVMNLLHITKLRPGANVRNQNNDESKANPFPTLPDPLVFKNGKKVTTPAQWWDRRLEIKEDFDREIYGRLPRVTPKVTWELTAATTGTRGDIPTITKTLVGHVDHSSYPLITVNIAMTLTLPAKAAGPSPLMLIFTGGYGGGAMGSTGASEPAWQQDILANGWGYAMLNTYSFQADNGAGLTQGIIGLCNKGQPRGLEDWGVLRAWAWGASRALDYFQTDKAVSARQVGVEGHSRWGKAALVAMAYDQRFAIAYISSSGEGGAKLNRRNWGELVENVAGTGEYHWMAGNFMKYAADPLTWNDMPVDSHELVAMCAPRPVFIGGGATAGTEWVDAKGMFMAAAAAQPVYALLGKKTMGTDVFPPVGTALIDGEIAFRQHEDGHTDVPNWPTFLTFAFRHIKSPGLKGHPATAPATSPH